MKSHRNARRLRAAVFGLGETGNAFAAAAAQRGWTVDGYSRGVCTGDGIRFDAAESAGLERLKRNLVGKRYDAVIVTFPPQNVLQEFWGMLEDIASRRILLGSTSIYQRVGGGRPTITETTPLKREHDRLRDESSFLQWGGTVVRLSGIYSRQRNPIGWLRKGRVGYEDRQVNLVHVGDIAAALCGLVSAPRIQSLYNLSDGQEHTWVQIVDRLVETGRIDHPRRPEPLRRDDGFVENRRFLEEFPGFQFRDFWKELDSLAGSLSE